MILVVLWSLAVYGATAALALRLAHRFVTPVSRRAALILAAAPLLFTGRAMLTGGVVAPLDIVYQAEPFHDLRARLGIRGVYNPLLVDVVSQMLPWRQAVREAVFEGRLPLWNPHVLAGEPLLAVQQPAVFHPGTWIGFLLPSPQAWTFDLSLRILLSLLCAFVYFRAGGASETAGLFGGVAWAFSDFMIFHVGYPVTPSVAPFPLLALGLTRLAERRDRRAVGITVSALVLIAIAGHPETLLFGVAGAGVLFLFELSGAPRGSRLRAVALSLAAGLLALGLVAVVLLPFVEILPQTWQHGIRKTIYAAVDRSEPPIESLRRFVASLVPYAYGVPGKSQFVPSRIVPAGYAGSLLFPLAAAGLTANGRRRWRWAGLAILGFALHARVWGVTDLLVALPLFDIAVCDYFIFLAIFGLTALAVLGFDRLCEPEPDGRGLAAFAAGAVAASLTVLLVAGHRAPDLAILGMPAGYLRERILFQVLPLLLALGLAFACVRRRRFGALAAGLVAVLVIQRRTEEAHVYPTFPAEAFYPQPDALLAIPREGPSRMTALYFAFTPNVAAMYGLEDVRGYEAMLFGPYVETYSLWSRMPGVFFNRVDEAARPFLSFLNVRHVLSPLGVPVPEGWPVLAEKDGVRVLENPGALPRAFVPARVLWVGDRAEHALLLARIPDFAHDGLAGGEGSGRHGWQFNPEARVRVESYSGQSLTLDVDAAGETFVGTSIPAWRGWRLSIDGRPARLEPFNLAFLGFEVPAGKHRAVLRYLPAGFVWGAGISFASVLLCLAFVVRRRGRTSP